MKKSTMVLVITNIVVFLAAMFLIAPGISSNYIRGLTEASMVLGILLAGVVVASGIPALIQKWRKRSTFFLASVLFGFFFMAVHLSLVAYLVHSNEWFVYSGPVVIFVFTLLHSIFGQKAKTVYYKIFRRKLPESAVDDPASANTAKKDRKLGAKLKAVFKSPKLYGAIAAILMASLLTEYFLTVRVVDISRTQNLDARSGRIFITYNRPVSEPLYNAASELVNDGKLHISSSLKGEGKIEVIKLIKPTRYNQSYSLLRWTSSSSWDNVGPLSLLNLDWFNPPQVIEISTGIEQVKIDRLIPAENSNPAPETLDNQIAIQFQGEVIGKYRRSVNIPIEEMDYVKLLTPVNGYFRWVDDSLLTFNFSGDKPKFSTTYKFEVFPDKFIKKEYQDWVGAKTQVSVTTSENDVYVTRFSLKNKVNWQDRLRIEFSGNMVGALDVLKRKSQTMVPVNIEPSAGGVWVWVNAKTLEFQPDEIDGWPVKKEVTVSIDPVINREAERTWRPDNPLQYSFYVAPREQSISSYNLHGEKVALEKELEVRFSRDLIPEDQTALPISNRKMAPNVPFILTPHVPGDFYWLSPSKVAFTPENLWPELKEIEVKLNPDFNPDPRFEWVGTSSFTFKTIENLVTPEFFLTPENRISVTGFFQKKRSYRMTAAEPLPEQRLWVLFDKELGRHLDRSKDLSELITITPQVEGTFVWLNNNLLEFTPTNNWKELTSYQVKLGKGLLYHPEQHYAKDTDSVQFKTAANVVSSPMLTKESTDPNQTLALEPDSGVHFSFSKNMKPSLKIGKRYSSEDLTGTKLPVTISPAEPVTLIWKDQRNLVIEHKGYWKPETSYTFKLGNHLLPQSESTYHLGGTVYFTTEQNMVRVSRLMPQGRTGLRSIIDISFDKKIRPRQVKIGEQDTTGMFKVQPQIDGEWVWLADNKVQLKPNRPLISSTRYEVTIDPNKLADKQFTWHPGKTEGKPYQPETYSFNTPVIRVTDTAARFEFNEKDFLKQKFYLDIQLSDPVQETDLRKHFSIWYRKKTGGEVPLIYNLKIPDKTEAGGVVGFSVVSDWIERPADDRRIYYKIASGLKPIAGNLDLPRDFKSDFLQEKPKYVELKKLTWKWKDQRYVAYLSLNAPVNPEILAKFLAIRSKKNKPLQYEATVADANRSRTFRYEINSNFLPGSEYNFTIKEGMLAADGAFNPDAISESFTSPDLDQKLHFVYKGNFLSKRDLMKVPVLSTNIDNIRVTIDQVFASNVNYYLNNRIGSSSISSVAKRVHSKNYKVASLLAKGELSQNREIVTHLDLADLFKKNKRGLYRISLGSRDSNFTKSNHNRRWFLATDIGLLSRRFGNNVVVWAYSLEDTSPLSGTRIELIDRWNQVVGKGVTDSRGYLKTTIEAGASLHHLMAYKGDDFSFLDFNRHQDRLTGYDVEGIGSGANVIRSYIYSERGVYRPGETAHLVVVTRSNNGILPKDYTVKFRLSDPKGKEIFAERFRLDTTGANLFDFAIPAEAKTGKWKANVFWKNEAIGSYKFQVEEFVPNKIKVELQQLTKNVMAGDTLKFKVTAKNLFGPPASGRPAMGKVQLRASYFKPPGFSDYRFGHEKIRFQRIDADLTETRLNDDGETVYEYRIPDGIKSPIGLAANYSATVIDDGGRGVAAYKQTNIGLFNQYVGIKKLTGGIITMDRPIEFKVVNVDPGGKKIDRSQQKLSFKVYRNRQLTHYRKNERGYYRYVTEKEENLVETLTDPRDRYDKFSYLPKYSGEHILEVEDKVGKQLSRYTFTVRSEDDDQQLIQPSDKVQLKVLNSRINIGDTIKLEVTSPFKGKLLLIGERESVLFNRVVSMNSKRRIISITAEKKFFPNFYISATALKPVRKGDRYNPIYSNGLVNVTVSDKNQSPNIALQVPAQVTPNGKLTVRLKIADTNRSRMNYTIAAVDVGILNLTRYQLPDMEGYFNQRQRLEVDHFSMYPMVMPYDPLVKRKISPSGDAPSRALIKKKRISPVSQRRISSVVLWSGILETNANGEGSVTFDVPDFDGTLKVMAVAFGDQRFASRQKEVLVKDRLVAQPTLPRFVATGDRFYLPVFLYNDIGQRESINVTLQASEHMAIEGANSRTIDLKHKAKGEVGFFVKANHVLGVSRFQIVASSETEKTTKTIHVPVRTPGTARFESGSGSIDQFTPKSITMPDIFINGTQQYAMKISNNKLGQFSNSLSYLLRYPHGCLEQTTSKVFPLLYYSDIAETVGAAKQAKPASFYLSEGIAKISRMQLEDGSFSYWEGGERVNQWSFVYASHFLVEAQKVGLKVNDTTWNNMIYRLNQDVSRKTEFNQGYSLDQYIYSLYVLALANENVSSRLNHIYERFSGQLKPHQQARLAAAFHKSGDTETAVDLINRIDSFSDYQTSYRFTGGDFSSNVRDLAIILDSITTVDPESTGINAIMKTLVESSRAGRWGSTQENAYAFLAIGKALKESTAFKSDVTITLADGTSIPFNQGVMLHTPELLKGEVRITLKGDGEVNYVWEAFGIERSPKSLQVDEGVKIRRRFLDHKGELLDLETVRQGDLVVAEIKIQSLDSRIDNLVISDLLPTGLEIENARLTTSSILPWLKQDIKPDYVDIRDDRINFFVTIDNAEKTLYYTARAVTKGQFKIPMISAEAMYDADIYSKADGGNLKILSTDLPQ